MSTKSKTEFRSWERLGGPAAGTVSALLIASSQGSPVFAGAEVGLYQAADLDGATIPSWTRLASAPVGVLCLAASPNFTQDRTLFAGVQNGLYISTDAGITWHPAQLNLSKSTVLALCPSPDFQDDGMVFAGTLEDGVIASVDRGEKWSGKSFGLLDGLVYSIALSPNFTEDGVAFAGAETALYYSYNHARAWKMLPFPEEAAPVLCVAVSPRFASDHTVYAGTEAQGLFRSTDHGRTWHKISLPARCINALVFQGQGGALLAGTDDGVFQTLDGGETWTPVLSVANVLCLAAQDGLALAGTVAQGAWMRSGAQDWAPVTSLASRTMLHLALSPGFEADGVAYMAGPEEGVWQSRNGGKEWACVRPNESGEILRALEISPQFTGDQALVIAASSGLWLGESAGEDWSLLAQESAELVAFAPDGKHLAAYYPGQGIRISTDRGKSWQTVPGPWESGGKVLALALGINQHLFIAFLEGIGAAVSIWHGLPGELEMVLSCPAPESPWVEFWIPPGPAVNRPWFMSLGNQVWRFSARKGAAMNSGENLPQLETREKIIALTGWQEGSSLVLAASTGRQVFKSSDAKTWQLAGDFQQEHLISLAFSPADAHHRVLYALLLGGGFFRGSI